MQRLKCKLKSLDIELVMIPMEKSGYYVPSLKKIFVNEKLNNLDTKTVILHELKHVLDHTEYMILYKQFAYHSKMEAEADNYMVTHFLADYNDEYNYSMLLEEFNIGMGYDTKYRRSFS